ncbi:MAG: MMPL family transporter, partial [Actinomycetia bacterium]|nr:MMPL family transporter [Actinomycetes bacterium]
KGEDNQNNTGFLSDFFKKYSVWLIKHKTKVYGATIIIILIFLGGMTRVWVNSSFIDKFDKSSTIVKTDRFINEHFSGTSSLNVVLEAEAENTFKTPEVLTKIDQMQNELESADIVGGTFSIADFLKRMNKVMHSDNEEFNRIPEGYNMLSQYLLLYEMSADPENLLKFVDYNYSKINVVVKLKGDSTKDFKKAISIVEKYKEYFKKNNITVNYAGSGYKSIVFTDLIFYGQIISLGLAILLIFFLITVMFKSVLIGLIGSIPVSIAIIINFGMMGMLKIPLNNTTALLSSIAIGIGIDYAIHLIQRYKIYSKQGHEKMKVLEMTLAHSGKAVLMNSIVVVGGFIVLAFSKFPRTRALGALVSINMLTTFFATITVMLVILHSKNLFSVKEKK